MPPSFATSIREQLLSPAAVRALQIAYHSADLMNSGSLQTPRHSAKLDTPAVVSDLLPILTKPALTHVVISALRAVPPGLIASSPVPSSWPEKLPRSTRSKLQKTVSASSLTEGLSAGNLLPPGAAHVAARLDVWLGCQASAPNEVVAACQAVKLNVLSRCSALFSLETARQTAEAAWW